MTITIDIRCFLIPLNPPACFNLGQRFADNYPRHTTLKFVLSNLFGTHDSELGVISINGKLVEKMDTMLVDGDHVDIFPLIQGG